MPADPLRTRIGLWGRFDAPRFEDLVLPWIFEQEIRRRLPEADVQTYAPLEGEAPGARDGGFAAVDLGEWSAGRAGELSEALDCAFIAGDLFGLPEDRSSAGAGTDAGKPRLSPFLVEGLGPKLEKRCPVAWSAVGVAFELDPEEAGRVREALASRPYVSVRDEASRDRLRRAGVETDITVVPDLLLSLPSAFSEELLARRLGYLRHMEWFPRSGAPFVVQGSRDQADRSESFGKALATALERQAPVVLLELDPGRGEAEFLDAISGHLSGPTFRVPPEASASDLVAVLSYARAFVGSSARASVACSAFGVPSLLLESLPVPRAEVVRAARRLLETRRGKGVDPAQESEVRAHFDRLAGIAQAAAADRLRRRSEATASLLARLTETERILESWRKAYSARGQQVVDQRLASAALTEKLAGLEERQAAATSELAAERARREGVERELSSEKASLDDVRAERARIEGELSQTKARAKREIGELRQVLEEASRREKRAQEDVLSLRTELDRSRERLEKARSDYSELRVSQTLLLTEVSEVRADAGRFAARQDELEEALAQSEKERDRALAELSRLETERARARQEIEDLQAELDRLSARSPKQIPPSLRIRIQQLLSSAAGEPRGET